MTLTGRFLGADGREALFAPDLAESVAWGDARHRELMERFYATALERGIEAMPPEEPAPFDTEAPERNDLSGFGAVIFTGDFRPDYRSWLPWPAAFDDLDFLIHRDGESTVADGLYFVGVPFLRARKSVLLKGVGEDASAVVERIVKSHERVAG